MYQPHPGPEGVSESLQELNQPCPATPAMVSSLEGGIKGLNLVQVWLAMRESRCLALTQAGKLGRSQELR